MGGREEKIKVSMKKELNIGIITPASNVKGQPPISNLVDILSSSSNNIHVITASGNVISKDTIEIKPNIKRKRINVISRIINYIYMQFRISYASLKLLKIIDLWIFFSGEGLILPLLTIKLFKKKVMLVIAGSYEKESKAKKDVTFKVVSILANISYVLSDNIILYSKSLIKDWGLEKYRSKILIANKHFVNYNVFKAKKSLNERENLVGYVGRLSEEKGVLNLLEAIPGILEEADKNRFLIAGDGPLYNKIKKYLDEKNLNGKVKLAGWIPHDKLPDCLNELKLVVLPSYTEGLPNLMLEAMACGTPVLATPVGAIPDMITDGETGFITENNSPECIAENVIRALEHPDLERIVENARARVEREFTYEAAVERYREILDDL